MARLRKTCGVVFGLVFEPKKTDFHSIVAQLVEHSTVRIYGSFILKEILKNYRNSTNGLINNRPNIEASLEIGSSREHNGKPFNMGMACSRPQT